MSLHPEVEKEIEAGPLAVEVDHDTGKVKKREHPQEFARRIALRAVELEREDGYAKLLRQSRAYENELRGLRTLLTKRGKP